MKKQLTKFETLKALVNESAVKQTTTEAENKPQGARLLDSLIYTSDGTAYTLNYYEGGTIERADTGQRQPITAEEWATLCHVLRDILGAA